MKSKLTHFERQLQHSWELMRIRQKKIEAKNLAEWDRGSKQFLVFVGIMLVSLYGLGALMTYICS